MRLNYKQLGEYIEPVNQLNEGMEVTELLGINNNKYFQGSHTNTIDIDLQTYRIVRTNQFAYNRATTRNGDKISIALRQGNDCIVSPSYRIFRSKDESKLNSEYLMMWFRRPEFDRYARFKSHGSAHEFFEYEQMCQVELPVPSPEKQKEIVAEYNTVQNRINGNKQLIQKLEETAQAIYKEFLDSFPTNNTDTLDAYVESANTGLDAIKRAPIVDVDTGVKCLRIQDISNESTVDNWGFAEVEKNNFKKFQLKKDDILVARTGATVGGNIFIKKDLNAVFNNGLIRIRADRSKIHPIILKAFFKTDSFVEHIETIAFGTSTQPNIQIGELLSHQISFPSIDTQNSFTERLVKIDDFLYCKKEEINSLEKLSKLLLSKLATIEN